MSCRSEKILHLLEAEKASLGELNGLARACDFLALKLNCG